MKDEMKRRTGKQFNDAVWQSDFLGWGKSRRKVYNQMRRSARRRMKHELRNMEID